MCLLFSSVINQTAIGDILRGLARTHTFTLCCFASRTPQCVVRMYVCGFANRRVYGTIRELLWRNNVQ